MAISTPPLAAQSAHGSDGAPAGWSLAGSKPANYRTGVDNVDGRPSAFLQSAVDKTEGFGTLMQTITASNYAGKRVRLRAQVKSLDVGGWAGLWLRVDKGHEVTAFDNMQNRPIKGTQSWQPYDVVLDVAEDATTISFGILLDGRGQVWMSNISFEAVDRETPLTGATHDSLPAHPVNLDFSE